VLLTLAVATMIAVAPRGGLSQDAGGKSPSDSSIKESKENSAGKSHDSYEQITLSGRVTWMAAAMQKRFGVQTSPEARERILALVTEDGQMHPIVEDVRGRAFRKDERLRQMPVQLLVRRYHGSPMIQVVRTYTVTDEGTFKVDYWCDICAIAMYELRDCACCQGPIRLRKQPVEEE